MTSVNFSPRHDAEAADNEGDFEDQMKRQGFIRKVFLIFTAQLLITLGLICIFVLNQDLQDFVTENPQILIVAFAIVFVTMITLSCCPNVSRTFPGNFVCIGLFTLAEGFLLGVTCSYCDPVIVLSAVGITAAVCFAITVFALQTKIDFTPMIGFLLMVLVVFLIFAILMIFIRSKVMMLIYCSCGVVIFSLYLLVDIQLMMGGKHRFSFSPDDYVFAALCLYTDVILIFMYILQLLKLDF